jgi:endonuclease V-like protein UPF0215 family
LASAHAEKHFRAISLARGGHYSKLNAKDMKLPGEVLVMTRPNMTRFPQALRETVGVEARRQRLITLIPNSEARVTNDERSPKFE